MGNGDLKHYEGSAHRPVYMVSDLLIQKRGYGRNLLAVEMKRNGNHRNVAEDKERLKALEQGSPLPIHRHRKTSETVVCLRGRLVWEYYDELERICTERIELSPSGSVVALNIPAGQWHTVKSLESGSVILEMKDGAYEPLGPADMLK